MQLGIGVLGHKVAKRGPRHARGRHHWSPRRGKASCTPAVYRDVRTPSLRGQAKFDLNDYQIRVALTFAPVWYAHAEYWPKNGDPLPRVFGRHPSAHGVPCTQYSRINAVYGLMLVTSALKFFDAELKRQGERHDAKPTPRARLPATSATKLSTALSGTWNTAATSSRVRPTTNAVTARNRRASCADGDNGCVAPTSSLCGRYPALAC